MTLVGETSTQKIETANRIETGIAGRQPSYRFGWKNVSILMYKSSNIMFVQRIHVWRINFHTKKINFTCFRFVHLKTLYRETTNDKKQQAEFQKLKIHKLKNKYCKIRVPWWRPGCTHRRFCTERLSGRKWTLSCRRSLDPEKQISIWNLLSWSIALLVVHLGRPRDWMQDSHSETLFWLPDHSLPQNDTLISMIVFILLQRQW